MATNFPGTAIDSYTNPSTGSFLNSPSHSGLHTNVADAVVAIETKIGINGSAVTTSLDYKLSGVTGSDKAASKTGTETLTNKTLTTPIISSVLNSGTITIPTGTDTLVGRATTDTLTNKTLTSPKVGTSVLDTNGALLFNVSATASAVNGLSIVNSATGNDPYLTVGGTDSNRHLNLRGKGLAKTVTIGAGGVPIFPYDFVYTGCVWSGDAYASTKNASMTAGTVVINGNPVTVALVTARVFTASKDTYIDVLDNGDGTGLLVYTEVTNNAASPALAANSIRIGIIVTGASNIAAAGSVNQGQTTSVLPIASSQAYSVSDSLGNVICNCDSRSVLLSYSQILVSSANTSASAADVDVAGLAVTFIAHANRKVKVSALVCVEGTAAGDIAEYKIKESSTVLASQRAFIQGAGGHGSPAPVEYINILSAGLHTFKFSHQRAAGSGTNTVAVNNSTQQFIKAELE